MLLLAFRNLFQSRARLAMATGGLALALVLILTLDAIFAGAEAQVSAYIDRSGADVWVSQLGVRNMHMASSSIPATVAERVRPVPGVASVTPILYMTGAVDTGHDSHLAYVIGLPPSPAAGTPWRMAEGSRVPGAGEAVISDSVARVSGIGLGATVRILGTPFRVAGLSQATTTIVNSIAFISLADFAQLRGSADSVSFLLVRVGGGQSAAGVASRIESEVGGVTVQTKDAFAGQERRAVQDMATDLVNIMNLVGLLIGLAVLALSVYTATLARRAEYGMLKAVGASNRHLYQVVLGQAFLSLLLGFVLSVGIAFALAAAMPLIPKNILLVITPTSVLKLGLMSLAIAAVAAVLPIRQMAGLDPSSVFRRRVQ